MATKDHVNVARRATHLDGCRTRRGDQRDGDERGRSGRVSSGGGITLAKCTLPVM